jgi:hypothetical protein
MGSEYGILPNQNRGNMFCSEILNLHLNSKAGRVRTLKVNLEEIWSSGALFLTDVRIRPFTPFRFVGGGYEFRGRVIAQKLLRGLGYFVEMQFDSKSTWSEEKYRPQHFFNPLVLLANRIFETTLSAPKRQPCCRGLSRDSRPTLLASFHQSLERSVGADL